MRRADTPLPADRRMNAEAPAFSLGARLELLGALVIGGLAIYLAPALQSLVLAWALSVHTSALGDCRPPSEFEQLHIVVANRAGQLVLVDCMHVGTKGTYSR
jgi:hypothetical protein